MKSISLMACLLVAVAPLAHATTVRANKLPQPKNMTCLQVKQTLSYSVTRGLLHIPFKIEIGQGAYVSEHEDNNGVYYRAPSGAITEHRTDVKEGSMAGRTFTFDGGIYIPNDSAIAPTLYKYYATDAVATQSAPGNADCSTLAYTVDPSTHKVSMMATGMAMGLGAAAGMATGRAIHPHLHTSYGQAAGAGLAGGLIGGLIVAAIENSKIGEILPGPALDDQTSEKIKTLAVNKVAVKELGPAGDPNMTATAPAQPAEVPSATQATPTPTGASTEMQNNAVVAPSSASVAASGTTALPAASATITNGITEPLAQSVANQMGCGAVKAHGEAGYVAPCGSYGI